MLIVLAINVTRSGLRRVKILCTAAERFRKIASASKDQVVHDQNGPGP